MKMHPSLRKFALTAHIVFSVGWLGAVIAYLPLAVTGLMSHDLPTFRAAYRAMELIGWLGIVPLSLAALISGLIQSLGTEWGLFRYYWIVVKLLSTIGATTILLMHMPAVSRMASGAARAALDGTDLGAPDVRFLVHAAGGLLVLLTTTALSVCKPWGLTGYGQRKEVERRPVPNPISSRASRELAISAPWSRYLLLAIVVVVLLLAVAHLAAHRYLHH